MPVIGTLTVDLVANTATFTADLGKAGNSLDDFGKKAKDAGEHVDYSMTEARHGVMMLGEEFGVHLPRGLTSFIASLGPVGAAMEAAFPFLAIALGATLLIEKFTKMGEAAEKLAESQAAYAGTSAKMFDTLGDKLLTVGIRTDELAGNRLGALRKQLELIDHQTLHELISQFATLASASEKTLLGLKTSWYSFSAGSKGALNAMKDFKTQYEQLLDSGKTKEAGDLLRGTTDQAKAFLRTKEESRGHLWFDQKDLEAQQAFVKLLEETAAAKKLDDSIGQGEKKNAKTGEAQAVAADQLAVYNAQQKGMEQRRRAEATFAKEVAEIHKKALKLDEDTAEEGQRATAAVYAAETKINQGLENEALKNTLTMAKIKQGADEEAAKHALAMRTSTAQQATAAEVKAVQQRLQIELSALNSESALLAQHGEHDKVKLQEIEDKKTQIIAQATAEQTKIRDAAAAKQEQDIKRAEDRMASDVAKNMAKGIFESKSMAQAFAQMGSQMLESAAENTVKMMLLSDRSKLTDAKAAARKAYVAVADIPMVGPYLAPAAAAAAFAGVMSFHTGGEIPGYGDVPIMAQGGETVIDRTLTQRLKENVSNGGGHTFHFSPTIQAIDGDGVSDMLDKHEDKFAKKMTSVVRKMNRKG